MLLTNATGISPCYFWRQHSAKGAQIKLPDQELEFNSHILHSHGHQMSVAANCKTGWILFALKMVSQKMGVDVTV
jgi:hypothetical protein